MKIVQLTDLHLAAEGVHPFEVDTRQHFLNALQKTRALQPDLVVITGDFCYVEDDPEVYAWVKSRLDFFEFPYAVIPGNHDRGASLAKTFGIDKWLIEEELFYKQVYGQETLLFLDTAIGVVSERQLEWIANEMQIIQGRVVVFMHHPPVFGGVPYMDKHHALKNRDTLLQIFTNQVNPTAIFCGHYHVDKTIQSGNVTTYITPSLFFQIDQHEADFKVDHRRVGIREIILSPTSIHSTVHYL